MISPLLLVLTMVEFLWNFDKATLYTAMGYLTCTSLSCSGLCFLIFSKHLDTKPTTLRLLVCVCGGWVMLLIEIRGWGDVLIEMGGRGVMLLSRVKHLHHSGQESAC